MSGAERRILLVPEVGPGQGSGHLRRCILLASELASRAHPVLLAQLDESHRRLAAQLPAARFINDTDVEDQEWDLVVIDKRSTTLEEFARFRRLGPVVGIDAAGQARERMSYLIDSLPRAVGSRPGDANERGPRFLSLSGGTEGNGGDILISFGGEDAGGLTEKCCAILLDELPRLTERGRSTPGGMPNITAVRGALFAEERLRTLSQGGSRIEVLDSPERLSRMLGSYRLIVTSFGLTAFEARAADVPVILINASPYHEQLARQAGFRCAGIGGPAAGPLQAALGEWLTSGTLSEPQPSDSDFGPEPVRNAAAGGGGALVECLTAIDPAGATGCPICGRADNRSLFRLPLRTYFRCLSCGMLYLENYAGRRVTYAHDYFFSEYRKQYGRTYLEDFANIRSMAGPRLKRIGRLAHTGNLLDVGCAYGPFLTAASESGYGVYGVDISEEAAAYVRDSLRLPAVAASILDLDPEKELGVAQFDVVTLWYVIEHFRDAASLLRKLNAMLRPGGLLAFSTPSGSGVSARINRSDFFNRSPQDHFTIWEPERTGTVLRRFGFDLRSLRITGHHPERFFRNRSNRLQTDAEQAENRDVNPLLLYGAGIASRMLGLGDTFEAYAIKRGEPVS